MSIVADQTVPAGPDARGRFGAYGGRYVPEVLIPALDELAAAWTRAPRRSGVPRRARRPRCGTSSVARRPITLAPRLSEPSSATTSG